MPRLRTACSAHTRRAMQSCLSIIAVATSKTAPATTCLCRRCSPLPQTFSTQLGGCCCCSKQQGEKYLCPVVNVDTIHLNICQSPQMSRLYRSHVCFCLDKSLTALQSTQWSAKTCHSIFDYNFGQS